MKLLTVFTAAIFATCLLPVAAEQAKATNGSDACFERANTTADMVVCADKEYQRLDLVLNRVYVALLAEMTPAQQTANELPLTGHSLATHCPLTAHSLATHWPLTGHSLATRCPVADLVELQMSSSANLEDKTYGFV